MYQLNFYVPESHLDSVKNAIFTAGGGKLGDYSHCCWQVRGEGQYIPLPGSDPYIGETDKVATVVEYKVEIVCEDSIIAAAVAAMKQAHPYEEPAYQVLKLEKF